LHDLKSNEHKNGVLVVRRPTKIRKTISIDKDDLETLKSFLDSNGNNLSLALRQLINKYRQMTGLNKTNTDQQKMMMLRNQAIENRIAELIPVPLIKWIVKRNVGVPPLGTFRVITEKYTRLLGIDNLSPDDYAKVALTLNDIFGYKQNIHLEAGPDSKEIRISFESEDSDHLKSTVIYYSCLAAHHPFKLKTKKVMESPNLIIVDYEHCDSEEEAYGSVIDYFGYNQLLFNEIQHNIQFWKNAVNIMRADHYEDIIISRDIFLQFLKSRDFSDQLNNLISIIYSVPIEDIDYNKILKFIEEICKTNGLIYRIEYDDSEIRVYHKFDDMDIISKINDTIIKTLETRGQYFELKKGDKMTILRACPKAV
jgi:hypothetical protein